MSDDDVAALVEEHRALAVSLARRYSRGSAPDPDLVQVAMLGVVLAAQRYAPEAGPFRPFATATAAGELKKHLRSHGWAAKVPRRVQEASITVGRAVEELEQDLGRSPTPREVSTRTGLPVEDVLAGLRAREVRFATELPISDREAAERSDLDAGIDLRSAMGVLDDEDRRLLEYRFEREMTQREIAAELGVSQAQVHRRLVATIERLRRILAASEEST